MKHFSFLLLAIGFSYSCTEEPGAGTGSDARQKQPVPSLSPDPYNPSGMAIAGDPAFTRRTDTVSAYGPTSITRNILQDKTGDLWFATWQGIIHYNGKVFTNMTLKKNLDHFHVFSVFEDRVGNRWFGTIGGGLYRYNGKAFTSFTTKDGLAGNTVFCMLEDKAGNMWFGTGSGLSRYDGQVFTNFTKKDGLLHDSVYAMVQDDAGKLWFGTEGGVNSYYGPSASLTRFIKEKELFFRHVMVMIKDRNGKLWIGSQAGLHCYDPRVGDKSMTRITPNFVSSLFEDKTGKIWFGGDVTCYDPLADPSREEAVTHFRIREGQNGNNLFCIFEDQSGSFWFGSMNGVRRYEKKPLPDGQGNFTEFRENVAPH